jgi:hypothetical protein
LRALATRTGVTAEQKIIWVMEQTDHPDKKQSFSGLSFPCNKTDHNELLPFSTLLKTCSSFFRVKQ